MKYWPLQNNINLNNSDCAILPICVANATLYLRVISTRKDGAA